MTDRATWRRVVTPTEHGGWAFLLEPILLGSLLAPSWAGACLALAAIAGFLTRQPLRILALDRRSGRWYQRTRAAGIAFGALAAIAAGAVVASFLLGRGPVAIVLAAIAVPAAIAVGFDLALRSRHLVAELAGALALAGVAGAMTAARGWDLAPSLALTGVLASRSIPSILYVRTRLRLDRGEPTRRVLPVAASALAVALVALLAYFELAPWLAVAAMGLLALRAAHGLSSRRFRMRTSRLGLSEIGFGLVTVLAVAVGAALEPPRYFLRTEAIIRSKSEAAADTVADGPVSLKNTGPCGPSTIAPISS